jgi:hypothetical protein
MAAKAAYNSAGFTLTLPESVNSTSLRTAKECFGSNMTYSNGNVKIGQATIYDRNLHIDFNYQSESYDAVVFNDGEGIAVRALLFYAEADVTISGSTDTKQTNLNLKQGWNWVYQIFDGSNKKQQTTAKPSETLHWVMR